MIDDVSDEERIDRWRFGVLLLGLFQAALVLANLAPQAPPMLTLLPALALGYVVAISRERAPGRWWFALAPVAAFVVVVVVLVGRYVLDASPAWWVGGAIVAAAPAVVAATTTRNLARSRA